MDWKRAAKEQWLTDYVRKLIQFRKAHKTLHPSTECQGIDLARCGVPDISYHGENAWQVPNEIASRQLGVFYSGQEREKMTYTLPTICTGRITRLRCRHQERERDGERSSPLPTGKAS